MYPHHARWLARLTVPAVVLAAGLAVTTAPAMADGGRHGVEVDLDDGRLAIEGSDNSDKITLRVRAAKPDKIEIDVRDDGTADFKVNRDRVRRILVEGEDGGDQLRIDDSEVAFNANVPTTLDGGEGWDTMLGGAGAERMLGRSGKDFADGNRGNDSGDMGSGDDVFRWDPGDGSDVIEGRAGRDEMLFNGAGVAEKFDVSANGPRVKFFRDVANITMDLDDVEVITTNALGGTDSVRVGNLSGTDAKDVSANLAAAIGGTAGDAAADRVVVEGTHGADTVQVAGDAAATTVTGLPATVRVRTAEPADALDVVVKGGSDRVDASGLAAGAANLTVDAGAGDDRVLGARGVETTLGGDGKDFADGNGGNDVGIMGAGDDTFQWDPGDGSDTVEGQAGRDELLFNGAGANENFDVSPNGGRVKFFRDVANITMDLDDVETITTNALGGTDTMTVNDLSGTDAAEVRTDLAGAIGAAAGDGAADRVIVNGTNGNDAIEATGAAADTTVAGLRALVRVKNGEVSDSLVIDSLGGEDTVNGSALPADAMALTVDGGAGGDRMLGGAGKDLFLGGDGNDFADGNRADDRGHMGAGDDVFQWDPGDGSDVVEGQDGTRDELLFNGAGAAENFDVSANGPRVKFFRDVASITMDLDDVEAITTNALGGPDTMTVNDLSGTDAKEIKTDLAGAIGGTTGDGAADRVTVNGTDGNDAIAIAGANGSVTVNGLPARVAIANAENANDSLVVNGRGGNDTFDSGGLAPNTIGLQTNQ